jgi:hypothetical protein
MVAWATRGALTVAAVAVGVTLNALVAHETNWKLLVFVAVATSIIVQLQLLFWARLSPRLRRSPLAKRAFLLFCAASYGGPLLAKLAPGYIITEVALVCVVCNVWLFFLCGFFSLLRLLSSTVKGWSREREAAVILVLLLLLAGAATYEAQREFEVNHESVHLGLSSPLSITLLSDLHFGPVLGIDFCERVAATVRRLDSDIVLLIGDIFDTNKNKLAPSVAKCVGGFANRKGMFYVTGNHGEFAFQLFG